jgi:co-chaperonin GroES (HSP10)
MALNPKVLAVRRAEFIPAPFFGKNESGCKPIGDRVLIRPDIAAAKSGSIELPQDVVERAQLASSSGVIVECGEGAFSWNSDRTRPFDGEKPKTGDRVYFDRYAGKVILGDDGAEYRLMDDVAIGGVHKTTK